MNQVKRVKDPQVGARLEAAVVQSYPSKSAFAKQVQVAPQTLAKWFSGSVPAGYELIKISLALPGKIEWILTGKDLSDLQAWQALLAPLSAKEQARLKFYAALVGTNDPAFQAVADQGMRFIEELIQRFLALGVGKPPPSDPSN